MHSMNSIPDSSAPLHQDAPVTSGVGRNAVNTDELWSSDVHIASDQQNVLIQTRGKTTHYSFLKKMHHCQCRCGCVANHHVHFTTAGLIWRHHFFDPISTEGSLRICSEQIPSVPSWSKFSEKCQGPQAHWWNQGPAWTILMDFQYFYCYYGVF